MTWFKEAFDPVVAELERAETERGILRHFITGANPEWFFIANGAHAVTGRINSLAQAISARMTDVAEGIGVLHVVGPSGSGKTTGIRSSLKDLVGKYSYIYEYKPSTVSILINFCRSYLDSRKNRYLSSIQPPNFITPSTQSTSE